MSPLNCHSLPAVRLDARFCSYCHSAYMNVAVLAVGSDGRLGLVMQATES
jgi:hypothetical protein